MKTSIMTSLLAAFPLAVMSAPAWTMIAYNSSFPQIHGKPITAHRGAFWVNNPTTSAICPSYDPSCEAANTTIISGPVYGDGGASKTQYWFMGVLHQGGQRMNTAGADNAYGGPYLEYVAVGATEIGVGVWDTPTVICPGCALSEPSLVLDNSTIGTLNAATIRGESSLYQHTWMACPYPNPYPFPTSLQEVDLSMPLAIHTVRSSSDLYPHCVRLEITLVPTTLAAPDYYYCKGCQWRCDATYGDSVCDANKRPACLEPYCGPYTEESKVDRVFSHYS